MAKFARLFQLLLTTIILSGLFLGTLAAQNANSGGIGGRPAFPREDNPRSESIFVHTLDAGESITDGINVINNTEESRDIAVYSTDSVNSSGGAFACAQLVDPKVDVGSWITLDKNLVTLEPSSSEVVEFNITVPENADVGEHSGCIVTQEDKPEGISDQGIGLSFRSAIRVAILVPSGLFGRVDIVKDLEIIDFKTEITDDKLVLTPFIENLGNVSVDTSITTTISHFYGAERTETSGTFPVLRSQTGEWNLEHERPYWGGFYKAGVSATYDKNVENFLGDSNPDTETINYDSVWIFVTPQPVAIAVYALAAITFLYLVYRLYRRRRAKRNVKKNWSNHKVKMGEDIKSLAKLHGISWKVLAKANNLKPPFTLAAGSTLRVPKTTTKAKRKRTKINVKEG